MTAFAIGFLGGGQMARALASGFVRAKIVSGGDIAFFDPDPAAIEQFSRQVAGAVAKPSNLAVAQSASTLFLAVKPQHTLPVLGEIAAASAGRLVVSIAAGVRLSTLQQALPMARVVRVMPNTPCLVGAGASAYSLGAQATADDAATVERLLASVGLAASVDEKLLDAVTGLSGSGPAFAFTIIEALSDGGVRMGLPRAVATELAAQTLLGAAEMVLSLKEHPAVLRDRVASPGGTTIAGLEALEAGGARAALISAVVAATQRSLELAAAAASEKPASG